MKAELLKYFGDDLMIANVARVSYDKESLELGDKDAKLLKFLADHGHTSPFRHAQLQFRIECPIFVERQLFTHQIGWARNCLHGDSLVRFKNAAGGNTDISIRELYNQWENGRPHQNTEKDKEYVRKRIRARRLRVMNEKTGVFEIGHIKDIFSSGKKELFRIRCQNGEEICCSGEHRIWTSNGWKTINGGLSSKDMIGLNGKIIAGNGGYRDKENLKEDRKNGLSVCDMADKYGCSYHTIRKYLKIHDLNFSKSETCFKINHKPWNKGKEGYKLVLTERGLEGKRKSVKRGNECHFWRGGITPERALIGQWTRGIAREVHEKYDFTCQSCGGNRKLHAHHILPVCTHPEEAYNFNNLVTVCANCHSDIHKSAESEKNFAENFLNGEVIKKSHFGVNKINRNTPKLSVHYSKIIDISSIGEHDTYDIEVDGEHHNFVANGIVVHNSISGRYVDFSDSYWLPEKLRFQSKDSKQGSAGDIPEDNNTYFLNRMKQIIQDAQDLYNEMSKYGIAKEQCRIHLPLALQTKFIWTGSMQAFIHLCKLRLKPDAQQETRNLVGSMLDLVKNIEGNPFEHTLKAWGY